MFVKTTVFVTQHPTSIRKKEREGEKKRVSEGVKADVKGRKGESRERANAVVRHFSIIKTNDV